MAAPTLGLGSRWRLRVGQLRARIRRYDFTAKVTAALAVLLLLLFLAGNDVFRSLQFKDEQLQAVGLRNQLVEFLLAIAREPDGSLLLDNPDDFAQMRRPLKVVTVRKPFFGFFLTRENARSFRRDLVRAEQPRPCVLEYPVDVDESGQGAPSTVQVCLAAVQNDPSGRYVYAIIKYPTGNVMAHRRGRPLKESDYVQLRFHPEDSSPVTLRLAMEASRLPAEARRLNPARFDGLYEVAGFLNADGAHPSRYVNGQAIERAEQPDGLRFVTIALRVDAAIFNLRPDLWPDTALRKMTVSLEIRRSGSVPVVISESQKGSAQVSLVQAYLASVPSAATLDIYKDGSTRELFWSSKLIESSRQEAAPSVMQIVGARIAEVIKGETIRASQPVMSPSAGPLVAEIRSSGSVVSDVAARVISWLLISGVLVAFLAALIIYVARALGQIAGDAMRVARRKHGDEFLKYKGRRDQIGSIGRVIWYLDRRIRSVVERKAKALEREEAAISQYRLGLHLIAHEISSPVATLLSLNQGNSENRRLLERMERAIAIFSEIRDVEVSRKGARPSVHDLAASLSGYGNTLLTGGVRLVYIGPPSGVLARYDDILLDQILQCVLDNARRYVRPGTDVELRLLPHDRREVVFEVFNQGPAASDTEEIFNCGNTTSDTPDNYGLGLYAARQYASGFNGSIHAENRTGGFAIVIKLEASQ